MNFVKQRNKFQNVIYLTAETSCVLLVFDYISYLFGRRRQFNCDWKILNVIFGISHKVAFAVFFTLISPFVLCFVIITSLGVAQFAKNNKIIYKIVLKRSCLKKGIFLKNKNEANTVNIYKKLTKIPK